ncbi:class I SAM-dependent DNA methyltransferase [Legionella spiritensis]|uniref:Methyltransferase n=1 Tax=Legionella spiritensis TaxID=452 RepID=A0A0W0YYJ8_LEGSP|nr:class I SAM-dependent methyltransferase [Legionella spiritensis]KTD61984.1 methyltransferase [Legionella spiritensis]SNV34958.1 methyltransferase [Legionella spiritensis]VEG89684.1 methyltransferase [Legionella spiritensis]
MGKRNSKNEVYQRYDAIVRWFDEHRSRELFERKYLDQVIAEIIHGGKILDLGCGMGEPIGQYFIQKGFRLTGVDGSGKMIALARQRFPNERFIIEDMRYFVLDERFDAIIAWHSFFHLPAEDQRQMFETFARHLKPGGVLLFTSGPSEGESLSDNGGQQIYHASLSEQEYQYLLVLHHFEIITHTVADPECGGATVWLAKYCKKRT